VININLTWQAVTDLNLTGQAGPDSGISASLQHAGLTRPPRLSESDGGQAPVKSAHFMNRASQSNSPGPSEIRYAHHYHEFHGAGMIFLFSLYPEHHPACSTAGRRRAGVNFEPANGYR